MKEAQVCVNIVETFRNIELTAARLRIREPRYAPFRAVSVDDGRTVPGFFNAFQQPEQLCRGRSRADP